MLGRDPGQSEAGRSDNLVPGDVCNYLCTCLFGGQVWRDVTGAEGYGPNAIRGDTHAPNRMPWSIRETL